MRYVLIFALLGACATPVQPPARDDLSHGASGYFTSQHEFASWVFTGCYENDRRVSCSAAD